MRLMTFFFFFCFFIVNSFCKNIYLLKFDNNMSMFLVDRCDVLTVEIEHVDVATMEMLEQQGVDCQPKASTIRIIQVCFSLTLPIGY